MIHYRNFKSLLVFNFIILLFSSFAVAQQAPTASISTTAQSVVLLGTTIHLDGTASTAPSGQNIFHHWSFVERPLGSEAYFTTPSPSMPSFTADVEGLYVAKLIVSTKELVSEAEYLIISAVMPAGNTILSAKELATPLLCSLTLGFLGCSENSTSFSATAGSYSLNVINRSATEISMALNSSKLALPRSLAADSRLSIPVTLAGQNELKVKLRGGMGSSIRLEIVENTLPQDTNAVPQVSDLRVSTDANRRATLRIGILDANQNQRHFSKSFKWESPFFCECNR